MKYQVTFESTPNPQSLKFILNHPICEENLEIKDKTKAARSPLASKILGFPWAKSVFIGKNFVTITKEEWLEWDMLSEPLAQMIKDHLERGEKVVIHPVTSKSASSLKSVAPQSAISQKDSAISQKDKDKIQKIKDILENEIQAAVAMDGGYVEFVSYEDQKVYLSLQGACSGCPSASYTLKDGIEARLKQSVPEIKEVIAL